MFSGIFIFLIIISNAWYIVIFYIKRNILFVCVVFILIFICFQKRDVVYFVHFYCFTILLLSLLLLLALPFITIIILVLLSLLFHYLYFITILVLINSILFQLHYSKEFLFNTVSICKKNLTFISKQLVLGFDCRIHRWKYILINLYICITQIFFLFFFVFPNSFTSTTGCSYEL